MVSVLLLLQKFLALGCKYVRVFTFCVDFQPFRSKTD